MNRYFGLLTLLLVVYVLVWTNVFFPIVRLTVPGADALVFFLAQFIPIQIIRMALAKRGWSRWPALTIGLLLLLPSSLGCGSVGCNALADVLAEDRVVSSTAGTVRIVRRPGLGATVGTTVRVYQECRVIPGISVVRELGSEVNTDQADVEWQAPAAGRISFKDNAEHPPRIVMVPFQLRRLCWGPAN